MARASSALSTFVSLALWMMRQLKGDAGISGAHISCKSGFPERS
jgi:hypothetical protein